ncbi:MAG TPA: matrixin family metalloprotease, partial [Planctomycetota bacterium]|nr:matrixin family metalloprotease [Planctomycetota bacterium]
SSNSNAVRNFDFDWQGAATDNLPNANTLAWGPPCSGGVLAFTTPGWRITMCENWTWADGPGSISGGQIDIQGVAAHELGHALGLDHSTSNCSNCSLAATMCAAICGNGTPQRDIAADDRAGLEAIYGVMPANKPKITAISGSFNFGTPLTITGQSFAPLVNVKFTAGSSQNAGAIPGTVFDVPSTAGGTQIVVAIPSDAKDGNVLVWEPGLGLLSNAFPINIGTAPAPPPQITGIDPATVPAFHPGSVILHGTSFTGVTQVTLAGSPVSFSHMNDSLLQVDVPEPTALGTVPIVVTASNGSSSTSVAYVETNPPQLEAESGAQGGLPYTWTFAGPANDIWFLLVSPADNSTFPFAGYDVLVNGQLLTLGALSPVGLGSVTITFPTGLAGLLFYSQIVTFDGVADVRASGVFPAVVIS